MGELLHEEKILIASGTWFRDKDPEDEEHIAVMAITHNAEWLNRIGQTLLLYGVPNSNANLKQEGDHEGIPILRLNINARFTKAIEDVLRQCNVTIHDSFDAAKQASIEDLRGRGQ